MTDNADTTDGDLDESRSREQMLGLLNDAIDESHEKAVNGRVYNPENEKVRQGWLRVFGYLAGQYRQLKKDQKLDELEERLDALEEPEPEGTGTSEP